MSHAVDRCLSTITGAAIIEGSMAGGNAVLVGRCGPSPQGTRLRVDLRLIMSFVQWYHHTSIEFINGNLSWWMMADELLNVTSDCWWRPWSYGVALFSCLRIVYHHNPTYRSILISRRFRAILIISLDSGEWFYMVIIFIDRNRFTGSLDVIWKLWSFERLRPVNFLLMKIILIFPALLIQVSSCFNWTWISGSNETNQPGIYGTKGQPSPDNVPRGRRFNTLNVHPETGTLILLGGQGFTPLQAMPSKLHFVSFTIGSLVIWSYQSTMDLALRKRRL